MREQLETKYKLELQHAEQTHSRRVVEMSRATDTLKAEVEQLQIQSQAQLEKTAKQERTIRQLKEDLLSRHNTTHLESEVTDLHKACAALQEEKKSLELMLLDKEGEVEVLQLELSSTKEQMKTMEEEIEERVNQANEWFRALKVCTIQRERERIVVHHTDLRVHTL